MANVLFVPTAISGLGTLVVAIFLIAGCGANSDNAKVSVEAADTADTNSATSASAPAASGPERDSVAAAFNSMATVKSYRVVSVQSDASGSGQSQVEGDLGQGMIDLTIRRMDGATTHVMNVGGKGVVSHDGRSTWIADTAKVGAGVSAMISAPMQYGQQLLAQGSVVKIGDEEIEAMPTVHYRVNAQTPVDIWVGHQDGIGPVIRKLNLVVTAEDGELRVTNIYSDYNKPVNVVLPVE